MFMFYVGKSMSASVFIRVLSVIFVCLRDNQSGYQALRATRVKDTKLTLAVIPF